MDQYVVFELLADRFAELQASSMVHPVVVDLASIDLNSTNIELKLGRS
jgi:hypothetical protein